MTRYLLDSNAVNAFVDRHEPFAHRAREARERGDRIGTCEPVVAELFYGLEFSASREENIVRLERGLSQIRSWPFDRQAARAYALIAAELKRRARKMQVVDMMIAAIASSLQNCVVVTTDSDLSAVSGLTVVNWAAPAVKA
jgi:tRNA(fMet)-specific endonuclease VapC